MVDIHNFVLGKGHVVDLDSDKCIIWPFHIGKNGYGYKGDRNLIPGKRTYLAHRWVWMQVHGPIPDDLPIDHKRAAGCTSRACVSLRHLEPVTTAENNRRMLKTKAPKAVCDNGHDLTLPGARQSRGADRWGCRECVLQRNRDYAAANPTYRRDYMRAYRQRVSPDPAG